jgi:hypothetical protein|tara:strand:- start:81 stop:275 length:195 start_codon:yes stop_codon:yes gene_type:complete
MDVIKLADYLYKNIRKRKEDLTQSLADGSIDSIEDYRFITGQIRGMTWVEQEIRASMKGYDLDD